MYQRELDKESRSPTRDLYQLYLRREIPSQVGQRLPSVPGRSFITSRFRP